MTTTNSNEQFKLRILSLGGVSVNKNMYVYESVNDIIIVDCGVAFPDEDMPGIDLIIPDVSYLSDRANKIRAIFLTHGHEDHRGGLPFILPELPAVPVYGTKLSIGLSKIRCEEAGIRVQWKEAEYGKPISLGDFNVEYVHVTHSIPDAANLIIKTPVGTIYHGSDFKFDWTPVDHFPTQAQRIAQAGKDGILCLLSDCLRAEKPGYTLSEKTIEDTFEQQIQKCRGKFIVTTQSSNISRIQQAVNVAQRHGRKIVFVGRSIEQNAEAAVRLGFLTMPKDKVIKIEEANRFAPNQIMMVVTGALGQENSALSRIANGDHKIRIKDGDMVIFSQDPIPGSEKAVDNLINSLIKSGAEVYFSAILDDLHVSGHEAADGLKLMMALTTPKFVWPIGGSIRHLKSYAKLAKTMGYKDEQIIIPEEGQTIEFSKDSVRRGQVVTVKNVLIDGLGVGDVGNVVLRDRLTMSADGIVMIVVPFDKSSGKVVGEMDIVSRGFVYVKESDELMEDAKKVVRELISNEKVLSDWQYLRRKLIDRLEDFFYKVTRRRPLILPVIVEV